MRDHPPEQEEQGGRGYGAEAVEAWGGGYSKEEAWAEGEEEKQEVALGWGGMGTAQSQAGEEVCVGDGEVDEEDGEEMEDFGGVMDGWDLPEVGARGVNVPEDM